MDRIRIQGGQPLRGEIAVSGAKNAALPIMAASLLTDELLHLQNLPDVADILSMRRLLQVLGASATHPPGQLNQLDLYVPAVLSTTAPYDLVRKMRASILVLGPLVARCGQAKVSLPGGCAIGPRPVDLHLDGLRQLGAEIELDGGYVHARVNGRLKGTAIKLEKISVGATENLIMAATLAEGTTELHNAAREPEVTDLANCLVAMGARIDGIGTSRLTIEGVERLHGASYRIVPDRIEAGTYTMAAAITGGEIFLRGMKAELFGAARDTMQAAGIKLTDADDGMIAERNGGLHGVDAMTQPFPGFATDLQAQFMATMCVADGAAMITETIFENRFMHVPELMRMGAKITVHGGSALVRGVEGLRGAPVMATDLRASVSLVLAGLAAEGVTEVNRVYHLDRGYERLEDKLAACGAIIERQG
ncbi:MAG: UDP-N-acetylglucosamine 1-carboxyvinyltransferase [Geminicoccaceae bacterium]